MRGAPGSRPGRNDRVQGQPGPGGPEPKPEVRAALDLFSEAISRLGFATPSVPHVLRNTFDEECVYLMGGEDRPIDVVSYPELDKRYLLMQTDKGTEFYELGEPIKPMGKPD